MKSDQADFSLQPLSQDQIVKIHQASLRVLAETGIMIDDVEARQVLIDSGATENKQRLCLPPSLVEKCVQSCPSKVTLHGRGASIILGDGNFHTHNLGGARDVFNPIDNSLRPAITDDIVKSTRLLDVLDSVSSITPLYTPRDVPAHMMVLTMFVECIRNTLKPVNGPGVRNRNEVLLLSEMMDIVIGNHVSVSLGASPVSPLNFTGEITQVMIEIARQGIPFGPLPCPSIGATAPMSLAGSLVLQNAEILASIVLTQIIQPGLPTVYCGRISPLNMRSGAPIWGNPEVGMVSAGTTQIGHYYHLPVNVYGLAGSGFAPDIQSGYERAINALIPALAGADELSGIGEMAGGISSSNAQIVIDNDIYSMIHRVCRGYKVDDDALAIEAIAHAMDNTRNFMLEPHTRRYLREKEIWEGQLGLKEINFDMWRDAGSPSVITRATQLAEKYLKEHTIPALDDNQERAISAIMKSYQNSQ